MTSMKEAMHMDGTFVAEAKG